MLQIAAVEGKGHKNGYLALKLEWLLLPTAAPPNADASTTTKLLSLLRLILISAPVLLVLLLSHHYNSAYSCTTGETYNKQGT